MVETSYLYVDEDGFKEIKIKPLFNCEPPSSRTILVSLVAILGISLVVSGILGQYDILSNLGTISLGMIGLGSALCLGLIIYSLSQRKENKVVQGVEIGTTDQETGLWTWEPCSNEEFLALRPFIPDGEYLRMRKEGKTSFVSNNGVEIIPEDESLFKPIFLNELRNVKVSKLEKVPYKVENQLALQRIGPNEFFWGNVNWGQPNRFQESICYKVDTADRFVSHGDETWNQALAFANSPNNIRVNLQTLLTRK